MSPFGRILLPMLALGPLVPPALASEDLIARTNEVEERTEALANTLHEVSRTLRQGAIEAGVQSMSQPELSLALPLRRGEPVPLAGPVSTVAWTVETPATVDPEEAGARWNRLLRQLATVEDMRFKITRSEVEGDGLTGSAKLAVVGRDDAGRREWLRLEADFDAAPDARGRWRLAAWNTRRAESQRTSRDMFVDVTEAAGVAIGPDARPWGQISAVGAATADVDLDGLLDLYVVGPKRSYLYRNRGDGTFEDVPGPLGTAGTRVRTATGALFLDHDRDGDPDLFLTVAGAGQLLFRNEIHPRGRLAWTQVTEQAGVGKHAFGHSAVTADVDGDGWLDIYVTSYDNTRLNSLTTGDNGTPNLLFLGAADGRFREVAAAWGVDDPRWGLAAELVDLDGDTDPDLLVANDWGGGTTLYRNEGGRFVDAGAELGLYERANGMGVHAADVDNDGDLDVHITNMSSTAGRRILARMPDAGPWFDMVSYMAQGNTVWRNDGGRFEVQARLGAGWAWGGGLFDLDNDGDLDAYAPNGMISGPLLHDT